MVFLFVCLIVSFAGIANCQGFSGLNTFIILKFCRLEDLPESGLKSTCLQGWAAFPLVGDWGDICFLASPPPPPSLLQAVHLPWLSGVLSPSSKPLDVTSP